MKKVFITLFCLSIGVVAAKAQDKPATPTPVANTAAAAAPAAPKPDPNAGVFKFKEEVHDYGHVAEGPLAETDFEFKNVGKSPIVISNAQGSCGCTVPKWPQEPILPGKKGIIHVAYTTSGRQGPIDKSITITSNAQQSPMVLKIKGYVDPKPADATATPNAPAPPAPAPGK
jgi:hypothetical protein